jgi:hypothetical protein
MSDKNTQQKCLMYKNCIQENFLRLSLNITSVQYNFLLGNENKNIFKQKELILFKLSTIPKNCILIIPMIHINIKNTCKIHTDGYINKRQQMVKTGAILLSPSKQGTPKDQQC